MASGSRDTLAADLAACGRLYDLPASADGQVRGRSELPEGFEVERIQVTSWTMPSLSPRLLNLC